MEMQPVRSSAIQSIGYDAQAQRLHIQFTNNQKIYSFCRVPDHIHSNFMQANSKGDYYTSYIRDHYQCP